MYHKQNPFLASIRDRYSLSLPGSEKETLHLVLDLSGSGMSYQAGDSIGVFPRHDPELVNKTLQALKASGKERVQTPQGEILLEEFLASKGNITTISPKLMKEISARQTNTEKGGLIKELLEESNREAMKEYLARHEVWDFLLAHDEVSFSPQEFVPLLMPVLPRFYSISSSHKLVGNEVHITIAPIQFESNGHLRRGVCTHFLSELTDLNTPAIPVFIQPSHGFNLPEDHHVSMIMIGPGTGVAPFRAFMQERLIHHRSKGKHWLFFGERKRAYNFYYEKDWNEMGQAGHLRLDLAFSRDQEQKVYVQHKMLENGEEFYNWLEEGSYLYVCGDANRMAKDVENTLQTIVQKFGKKDPQDAREYIKQMRKQKRYQRDVY